MESEGKEGGMVRDRVCQNTRVEEWGLSRKNEESLLC